MRENRGHARCNAFGIRYVSEKKEFDYLILMDGDGEDRPIELKKLIKKLGKILLSQKKIFLVKFLYKKMAKKVLSKNICGLKIFWSKKTSAPENCVKKICHDDFLPKYFRPGP